MVGDIMVPYHRKVSMEVGHDKPLPEAVNAGKTGQHKQEKLIEDEEHEGRSLWAMEMEGSIAGTLRDGSLLVSYGPMVHIEGPFLLQINYNLVWPRLHIAPFF